ncbi:ATPase inhibitor mai-2, mitochondrial-like [Ischnura elegans]|uniref:ATPase inhibitor mai-2, mitochondrial-like n=1 Tax=Ischnura elegans TaxID=197161 RepID=UPI001ED896D2|nr:ATPase inhibitor mai-2, mitochondrial-like [Ischnura elegans]
MSVFSVRFTNIGCRAFAISQSRLMSDSGGSSGSIREAGGAFGKMQVAHEEEYFYKQQKELLKQLKSTISEEISDHKRKIVEHEEEIKKHRSRIEELEKRVS